MATCLKQAIFLSLLLSSILSSSAQSCSSDTFSNNRLYSSCNSLPVLSASIHWNYHPSNGTVDVAYRCAQSASGWVAWALNPTGQGMIGAQALFAFRHANGSMVVYPTPISGFNPQVSDGNLSFPVFSRAAEFSNGAITIYATIGLPKNLTTVNQVWQSSTTFQGGVPYGHPTNGDNTKSTINIDFLSGQTSGSSGNSRQHRKNAHGILNAVSWGILMPIGVIMARYVKVFTDPTWFYLHVACQCSAYIVGVAGWGVGLKLGSESVGITYHSHRNIGISLFCLATLQVFALLLRPKKDHKYRIYWNVYHHSVGYSVIVLSIINIFKGFDILDPAKGWKHAYIAVIATLAGIALVLEGVTWAIVLKRRSQEKSDNVVNGINGHGDRQHYGV